MMTRVQNYKTNKIYYSKELKGLVEELNSVISMVSDDFQNDLIVLINKLRQEDVVKVHIAGD